MGQSQHHLLVDHKALSEQQQKNTPQRDKSRCNGVLIRYLERCWIFVQFIGCRLLL